MAEGAVVIAARFVLSAMKISELPAHGHPEVAFVGRSNVGKSSLVGRYLRQPALVRISRTPGRTQALNLFIYQEQLAVMDLPGYGYAKLSLVQRHKLGHLLANYIEQRQGLLGVVLVLDLRRQMVSRLDQRIAELAIKHHRAVLVAATKCDLVAKNKRLHHLRTLETSLGIPPGSSLVCSSKSGEGMAELAKRLLEISR